jgi:ADP-ribose pyrophosphatase YjhB (NUDIX family)
MEIRKEYPWIEVAKRLQAVAQAGLEYSDNKYDIDRYTQIRQISIEMMHMFTRLPVDLLVEVFASETGYQTPKVDVRGVVFRGNRILMVRETIDGRWSVPGGWADVGLTPFEVAKKEVSEEAGLEVSPKRLLAVLDKKCHNHPVDLYHIYKIFILCEELGGTLKGGMETSETGFFSPEDLPPLSEPRITREQILLMFEYKNNPGKQAVCD